MKFKGEARTFNLQCGLEMLLLYIIDEYYCLECNGSALETLVRKLGLSNCTQTALAPIHR